MQTLRNYIRQLLIESIPLSHITKIATLLTTNIESANTGISLGETLGVLRNPETSEIPFSTPWIVQLEASQALAHAIEDNNPEGYQASPLRDGWISIEYVIPG
jgi:hypothetical protein